MSAERWHHSLENYEGKICVGEIKRDFSHVELQLTANLYKIVPEGRQDVFGHSSATS